MNIASFLTARSCDCWFTGEWICRI